MQSFQKTNCLHQEIYTPMIPDVAVLIIGQALSIAMTIMYYRPK